MATLNARLQELETVATTCPLRLLFMGMAGKTDSEVIGI